MQEDAVYFLMESFRKDRGFMDIAVGDVLKLRKKHPCGADTWTVMRVGMDFRLACTGCGHQIMLPRRQVEKNIRQIIRPEE